MNTKKDIKMRMIKTRNGLKPFNPFMLNTYNLKKGELIMSTDFQISIHKNEGNIHLKLSGDFDSSSSHKVLNLLKKNCRGASNVFINTSNLNQIHPSGSLEREWPSWEQALNMAKQV